MNWRQKINFTTQEWKVPPGAFSSKPKEKALNISDLLFCITNLEVASSLELSSSKVPISYYLSLKI